MDVFQTHPFLIFAGIVSLVIALVFYLSWKRRKDLEELAASMGLSFSAEGPDESSLSRSGLEIFSAGHSRKASNLVRTQSGAGQVSFFDYHYVTGGGKHSQAHNFTLALIECSRVRIPCFDLKPEGLLYKIGEMMGFKDIDLPAFPIFSDKYRLTGSDEAAVHMFFTPQRAAWFERNPGLRVQGAPGHIILFKREGRLPVNSWQGFMEEVKAFAVEVLG